jgi:hypothetical protein
LSAPQGPLSQGKRRPPVGRRFKPGVSGNPGGKLKLNKELASLARESMPRAIARAVQVLDDDEAEPRWWLEAGKALAAWCGLAKGAPDGSEDGEAQPIVLSREKLLALAESMDTQSH